MNASPCFIVLQTLLSSNNSWHLLKRKVHAWDIIKNMASEKLSKEYKKKSHDLAAVVNIFNFG